MNKRIRSVFFLLLLLGVAGRLMAQQGFGTNAPASTAVVEMKSDTRGVLFPRVELKGNNDKQTILNPAKYLLVFNTKAAGGLGTEVIPGFYCWDGNNWIRLLVPDNFSFWHTAGDNGTTPTNFFGTLDEKDLIMKTNNLERMRITAGGTVSLASSNQIPQKNSVNASAVMELKSTNQGFLLPRMTTDQLYAIANPANGLLVYDTKLNCPVYCVNNLYIRADRSTVTRPAALGNTYTNLHNGIRSFVYGTYITTGSTGSKYTLTNPDGEVFSSFSDCTGAVISAGGCGGAIAVRATSGNVYPLLEINGQCWFAQNLYEEPEKIPNPPGNWSFTTDVGWYDKTNKYCNDKLYGHLYQWSAAMNKVTDERSQGVCPKGFHIPSSCELAYFEHGLGMSIADNLIDNTSSFSYIRDKCIAPDGVSGFSAQYGGWLGISIKGFTGHLSYKSGSSLWTSTSLADGTKVCFTLDAYDHFTRESYAPGSGVAVRCLKD